MKKKTMALAIMVFVMVIMLPVILVFTTAAAEDQLNHTVIADATYGEDVVFNADVVYDGGTSVVSAKVYYNTYGKSTSFTSIDMLNSEGNTYSATLEGKWAVVPYIYYYIEIVTDTATLTSGSLELPHRIAVGEKAGYAAPKIMVTESIAIAGNRADFVELKNIGTTAIELSKLSLVMNEYICDGAALVIDETNFKGESFIAVSNEDGKSKSRITAENEILINPGDTFVVFTGKTADVATEQGGLASTAAAFNFDYIVNQYTASRVGELGSNIEALLELANTKAFLTVSDPYSADEAILPDPSANYQDTAYGTMWTVMYDGVDVTRVVMGMNNDGTPNLLDKSTKNAQSATNGFGSIQYSPYFVDVTYGETTLTMQSRLTAARETGITIGADKALPSLNAIASSIELDSKDQVKQIVLSEYVEVTEGGYYANEYDVAFTVRKGEGAETPITEGIFEVNGEGEYIVTATFTSSDFDTFTQQVALITMVDTEAPVLTDLVIASDLAYDCNIDLSVTIQDNKTVAEAAIFVKYAGNADWTSTALVAGENDVYTFSLSNVRVPKVFYYIEATDLIGNIGRIGSPDTPEVLEIAEKEGHKAPMLIITEANAIKGRRADFVEIFNNSNKPIALSDVVIKRYDYIITNGVFTNEFIARNANASSTIAICDSSDDNASRTEITAVNDVIIPSGATFTVFFGNMNAGELNAAPYNLNYIRSFYNAEAFPNIDLSGLVDNVNAFVVTSPMAPSPTYTELKYGTAYAVEYKGAEMSVAVVGMDNQGNLSDDASVNTTAASVGSLQFAHYQNAITINEVTQVFQTKISENKQAVINFNQFQTEQVPADRYIVRPEAAPIKDKQVIYGSSGIFDLTTLYTLLTNGYNDNEYTITAKADTLEIADLTKYEYTAGLKTLVFTVASTESVFESYQFEIKFEAVDIPVIQAEEVNSGLLIYGQIDSLDVHNYFTITDGAFADQYDVEIRSSLPLVDNDILVAGDYEITIVVTPTTEGAFETIEKSFLINVVAKTAPSVSADKTEVKEMITGTEYDLTALFTVNKGTFENANVIWTVTRNEENVTVQENKITASEGIYTVRLSIAPETPGEFDTVESTAVTLTLELVEPSVEIPETVVDNEVSVTINKDSEQIDITSYFEVDANSFEGLYTVSYEVTKGGEKLTLSDNKLPNIAGEYVVSVRIASSNEEFEDVVKTITVKIIKNIPAIGLKEISMEAKKGAEIDIEEYFAVTGNNYDASEYTVTYSVSLEGREIEITQGKFTAKKAGEYQVKVTVTAKDGSFEPIVKTFEITSIKGVNTGLIVTLFIIAGLILAGVAAMLIKNKKKS